MRKTQIALAIAGIAAALFAGSPAEALVAASAPDKQYVTKTVVVPVGGPLVFANVDLQPHNVVAFKKYLPVKQSKRPWCAYFPKRKCPLFWSDTIGNGEATQVMGLENLKSGKQYVFYCSIHPDMKGSLVVL